MEITSSLIVGIVSVLLGLFVVGSLARLCLHQYLFRQQLALPEHIQRVSRAIEPAYIRLYTRHLFDEAWWAYYDFHQGCVDSNGLADELCLVGKTRDLHSLLNAIAKQAKAQTADQTDCLNELSKLHKQLENLIGKARSVPRFACRTEAVEIALSEAARLISQANLSEARRALVIAAHNLSVKRQQLEHHLI